jgi:hypothetical protein
VRLCLWTETDMYFISPCLAISTAMAIEQHHRQYNRLCPRAFARVPGFGSCWHPYRRHWSCGEVNNRSWHCGLLILLRTSIREWIGTVSSWPQNFEYRDMAIVGKDLSRRLRDPNGEYKCDFIIALTHAR